MNPARKLHIVRADERPVQPARRARVQEHNGLAEARASCLVAVLERAGAPMTQILKPTDAMLIAGGKAADKAGVAWSKYSDLEAIYTAMESARDPDELREALERARKHVEFVTRAHAYISADLIDARETLAIIDTALSRNVGDVG